MSQILKPWIFHTRLLYAFFQEHASAQKMLGAALLGVPLKRVLALEDQGIGMASGQNYTPALGMRLILDDASPVSLEFGAILPASVSPNKSEASPLSPHPFSISQKFRPLSYPSDFRAEKPFVRVILTYENPERKNPFFYGELLSDDPLISTRVLNLCASPPAAIVGTALSAFSHFFLITHSSELPALTSHFPAFALISPFLDDILKERELSSIFSDHGTFSPAGSSGIFAMCSLNRLLLRENRITDLKNASRDPEALKRIFQEFRDKGYL